MSPPGIDERLAVAGLPPLPRGAWLEVDLDALAGNLRAIRGLAAEGVEVWPVIKADAYGHGIEACARTLVAAGAERLCVASLEEAQLLRRSGIEAPIVLLFGLPSAALERALDTRLELTASDAPTTLAILQRWREVSGSGGGAGSERKLTLHLEIETGLGRAGVLAEDAPRIARAIVDTPGVSLAGTWTHLTSPEDAAVTGEQVRLFDAAVSALREAGIDPGLRHAAASGALFAATSPHYEAVRPGLALFGVLPVDVTVAANARAASAALRPVMALKARPMRIETLPPGWGVSYGRDWRAQRPSRIASLPLGYADGFARAYWPGSSALVRGRRVPLVGRVAMDCVMADVTDLPGVGLDDEFVLIGEQGSERITVDDLAHQRTTISWEVLTSMAQRIARVYHARSVPVAVRTLLGEIEGETE